jgi:hypothetical protein
MRHAERLVIDPDFVPGLDGRRLAERPDES